MLRSKSDWVVAVRRPSGEIALEEGSIKRSELAARLFKVPIIRGILSVFEMLVLGTKTIGLSLNLIEGDEDGVAVVLKPLDIFFSLALAILFSILLFIVLPSYLIVFLAKNLESPFLISLFEGLIRIGLFIIYLLLISRSGDIRRVFQYHGAEHKVIHAFEAGDELTPERAAEYSPFHVGCGTAFIIIAFTILILVFSLLGRPPVLIRIAERLLLAPLVVGISYELIKLARKHEKSRLVRFLLAPGLLLQRLTTKEPDSDQIEVALASLARLTEKGSLEDSKGVEILQ